MDRAMFLKHISLEPFESGGENSGPQKIAVLNRKKAVLRPRRTIAKNSQKRPLNRTGEAVLKIIRKRHRGNGVSGKQIVAALEKEGISLSESTLRKHYLPLLLADYGVVSQPAAGGYLIPRGKKGRA